MVLNYGAFKKMKSDPNHRPRAINVTPDPAILDLFASLEIQPYGCISELIDNSLDNFNSSDILGGEIDIKIGQDEVKFSDNGSGLTLDQVERALTAASSSKSKVGELGLFGIGFNLATTKLGTKTTVFTKKAHDKLWVKTVVEPLKMSQNKSYELQPEYVDLDTKHDTGLIIEIKLRPQLAGLLSRPTEITKMKSKLGKTYSYILRTEVPGLPQNVAGDQRDFSIALNGEKVTPYIPCIWDEKRKMRNGEPAVQLVDRELVDIRICQACSAREENDHNGPCCSTCGEADLKIQTRHVWGWLGVQRSIESEEYGIDLIRNGRIIEFNSKDFFKFEDPDTQTLELEYPIEQTNRGRIVGEIHCDHVPVVFTKQGFERTSDFRQVVRIVRGRTWLRPQYAREHIGEINDSIMALVYAGVRRIDPGKKYLTPGNGKRAILKEAANWAGKFRSGDEGYWLDTKWWEACVSHDELVKGKADNGNLGESQPSTPDPFGTKSTSKKSAPSGVKKPKTIKELADGWRAGSSKREDLSKALYLKIIDHKFEMLVWESVVEIKLDADVLPRPSYLLPTTGSNFEIFVSKKHALLHKFGRSATDIALGEAAHHLANQGKKASYGAVLAELIENYPDEENSEGVSRQRCNEFKHIIRARLPKIISNKSNEIWNAISREERAAIEAYAANNSQIDLRNISDRGEFARYITWSALIEVIEYAPESILNNQLFSQSLGGEISTLAKERVIGSTIDALKDLIVFEKVGEGISKFERDRAEISITFIQSKLAKTERPHD
jgi:hypothetical protein